MAVIYLDEMAVIYLNEMANLLELENPPEVRFLYPKISKRLGRIIKEVVNRLIPPPG